jgi:hypothetical protein
MWRRLWQISGWLIALALVMVLLYWRLGSRGVSELERYKGALRAQGEQLSFADLGFPHPSPPCPEIIALSNATLRVKSAKIDFGRLTQVLSPAPGRMVASWRQDEPLAGNEKSVTTWVQVIGELAGMTNELQIIRTAALRPCGQLLGNPSAYITNFNTGGRTPFVQLRTAAQLLYAECLASLHQGNAPKARESLLALIKLSHFGRDDPTLVSAMIRVAIANLALQGTWQALQVESWSPRDLVQLQAAWDEVDLLEALEFGYSGERAATLAIFDLCRQRGVGSFLSMVGSPANPSLGDRLKGQLYPLLWRADDDELLALKHYAEMIEAIRSARHFTPWLTVRGFVAARQSATLSELGWGGWFGRSRYTVSHLAIPNTSRAVETTIRAETQRLLAIAAIAVRRHMLASGKAPKTLAELCPDYLPVDTRDPMSGKPFGYQPQGETHWRLYSVGENGVDDGGNPEPTDGGKSQDQWSGRDVLWPVPAN